MSERGALLLAITVMAIILGFLFSIRIAPAFGHDDGRYANSPLKEWFDGLRSGKGPCCSDADGSVLKDVDWESKDGHYRVRIDGEWINVDEDAVLTTPNRYGPAMVWPLRGYMGVSVRCFLPGSMT